MQSVEDLLDQAKAYEEHYKNFEYYEKIIAEQEKKKQKSDEKKD